MPHFAEVLSPEAHEIFTSLLKIPLQMFYLAGGTGLALQIRHRISVDFDFFSSQTVLDLNERERLKNEFHRLELPFDLETDKEGTLLLVMHGVRISFFHYPYSMIEPLVNLEGLRLAGLQDIGAMKFSAIVSRGTRRDFLDLHAIAQTIPLEGLLQKAAEKYGLVTDFPLQAIKALTYFDDAETEPMPKLLKPVTWDQVRNFFETQATEISKRWMG